MSGLAVRVSLVVDNRAAPGFMPEHGLSMWIEADSRNILFDTGLGPALDANATPLSIDLGKTDALVFSHSDHTGGVDKVIGRSPSVSASCHSDVRLPRYAVRNGEAQAIPMPRPSREALAQHPTHLLHWASHSMRISQSVDVTYPVPRISGYTDFMA